MARTGRPKVERVTVECAACGKKIERYAQQVANSKTGRFFCSRECQNVVGSKPRRKAYQECQTCGKRFYPRSGNKGMYCSIECHNVAQTQREELRCETCGKLFEAKPSQIEAGRKFCSRTCYEQSLWQRPLDRMHNGKPALMTNHGYVQVWEGDNGWVLEHRLVVEKLLGRSLESDEHVHHINGNKADNRTENLMVMGHSEHSVVTNVERLARIQRDREELKRYRMLYGPLPPEEE